MEKKKKNFFRDLFSKKYPERAKKRGRGMDEDPNMIDVYAGPPSVGGLPEEEIEEREDAGKGGRDIPDTPPVAFVYAGPEYFSGRAEDEDDLGEIECVYAGPEYFGVQERPVTAPVYAGPDFFSGVYAGPAAPGGFVMQPAAEPEELPEPDDDGEGNRVCPVCGNSYPAHLRFCPECGSLNPSRASEAEDV